MVDVIGHYPDGFAASSPGFAAGYLFGTGTGGTQNKNNTKKIKETGQKEVMYFHIHIAGPQGQIFKTVFLKG
jgi:hypothetical protein